MRFSAVLGASTSVLIIFSVACRLVGHGGVRTHVLATDEPRRPPKPPFSAKGGGGCAARSSRGSVSRALELEPCKAAKIPKQGSITSFGMINARPYKPPWSSWRLCNLLRRFGANLESPPATRRIELGQSSPLSSSAPCPRLPRFGKRAFVSTLPRSFLSSRGAQCVTSARPYARE